MLTWTSSIKTALGYTRHAHLHSNSTVDLFVNLYDIVNPLLKVVLILLVSFIKRPHRSVAGFKIAAFVRLMSNVVELFSDYKWF